MPIPSWVRQVPDWIKAVVVAAPPLAALVMVVPDFVVLPRVVDAHTDSLVVHGELLDDLREGVDSGDQDRQEIKCMLQLLLRGGDVGPHEVQLCTDGAQPCTVGGR